MTRTVHRKVALITGGSRGLGAEFARQLARHESGPWDFWLASKDDAATFAATAAELRATGAEVREFALDLCSQADLQSLVGAMQREPRLRLLVNNAGYGLYGGTIDRPATDATGMIDLNVTALTVLGLEAAKIFVALPPEDARASSIINVASTAAFQALPFMNVYAATKAYVLSFSEGLHDELKRFGVRVTTLCPGPTKTRFWAVFVEGAPRGFTQSPFSDGIKLTPEQVVRGCLATWHRGDSLHVPGFLNRIQIWAGRFASRRFARRVAVWVLHPKASSAKEKTA